MSGFNLTLEPERQVHRFEVINGPGGRRRWTLDDKARIVAETLVPGRLCQRWRAGMVCGHSKSLPGAGTRFLDNGRIEIDFNTVERFIRPIALNRKNALFAGSDGGAEHWAVIASLIETCKLNNVEPLGLADVLTRIVNDHSNSHLDCLLPWAYIDGQDLKPTS